MKERIITDTDFIPSEHYLVDSFCDVYQLEYELLYRSPDFNRTHDNIVKLVRNLSTNLIRKALLMVWKQELDRTYKSLKSFSNNKYETIVYVPITNYEERIETTIQQFSFARILLDELITNPSQTIEYTTEKTFTVPTMYELFADALNNFQYDDQLPAEDITWYRESIIDEMIRRGLSNYDKLIEAGYSEYGVKRNDFKPSSHYNDKSDYFETFFAEDKEHLEKVELEKLTSALTDEQLRDEDNRKVKCGVLYYSLKDKLDDYHLTALINYACRIPYNKKVKKENKNTIEKYLRLYRKRDMNPDAFFSEDLKPHVFEDINKIIAEYELELPEPNENKD